MVSIFRKTELQKARLECGDGRCGMEVERRSDSETEQMCDMVENHI